MQAHSSSQSNGRLFYSRIDTEEFSIPDGVISLAEYCLRYSNIGILNLPDSLLKIGTERNGCVLADCTIGEVEIPRGVERLGDFAFGGSTIGSLIIHGDCLASPYSRQFKGARIRDLQIHTDWSTSHDRLGGIDSMGCNIYEIGTLTIYLYKEGVIRKSPWIKY